MWIIIVRILPFFSHVMNELKIVRRFTSALVKVLFIFLSLPPVCMSVHFLTPFLSSDYTNIIVSSLFIIKYST